MFEHWRLYGVFTANFRFHIILWCFHYRLRTSRWQLSYVLHVLHIFWGSIKWYENTLTPFFSAKIPYWSLDRNELNNSEYVLQIKLTLVLILLRDILVTSFSSTSPSPKLEKIKWTKEIYQCIQPISFCSRCSIRDSYQISLLRWSEFKRINFYFRQLLVFWRFRGYRNWRLAYPFPYRAFL